MTPQEWIKDTLNRWPSGHHVAEGATHLAAALEEITEIRKASAWIVDCEKWDSGTQLLNEKAVAQARIEHRRSSMQASPTLPPSIEEWMMLVARRQGRDESAEEIARLRADASTASPSCDRCQSAHCCSVTGSTVPPLCVTDPDGSLPLWMPWTNVDVQARVDPLHAEINKLREEKSLIAGAMRADDARLMVAMARVSKTPEDHLGFGCDAPEWMADEILRLRAEAGRVVVPELAPDGMSTAAFVEGYRLAVSRAHSVPSSRVLKDGEVAVDAGELAALRKLFSAAGNTIANIRSGVTIAEINDAWAGVCSAQIMRTQATATESGEKDADIDENGDLVHSGKCTYCRECREAP